MAETLSPRRLRNLRDAVAAFRDDYEVYVEGTLAGNIDGDEVARLRSALNGGMAKAQAGLLAAGLNLVIHPPRATGGPSYSGLRNVAFLFERPGCTAPHR